MTRRSFLTACLSVAALAETRRIRVLLFTGLTDEQYHFWRETTPLIRSMLEKPGIFEVRNVEEPRALTPASLNSCDVLFLNYNGPRFPAATEKAIQDFVHGGKGLVAFHHASYGEWFGMRFDKQWHAGPDAGWTAWAEMIGATWKPENIGHSIRHPFAVEWADPAHPIAKGLPAQFMANDELYHKLDLRPQAKVLATAFSDPAQRGTGRREPIAWTVNPGKGRVFFTTLGHDTSALYQSGVQALFTRATEWAATGTVTTAERAQPVRVLAVTSGHSYPVSFYSVLNEMPGIQWQHAASHAEIRKDIEQRFDVILLHDMHNSIAPETQERLKRFVEAGRGVIQLHHAIVNYTAWPWWWQEVTGGKYFEKAEGTYGKSSFQEDVDFAVTPVKGKERHPVLAGVGPLWVHDEKYRDMWHSPKIDVLVETNTPGNDRPVVYIGPHPTARVVYIQLGHSDHTMKHPGFRRLLRNALFWTARRT